MCEANQLVSHLVSPRNGTKQKSHFVGSIHFGATVLNYRLFLVSLLSSLVLRLRVSLGASVGPSGPPVSRPESFPPAKVERRRSPGHVGPRGQNMNSYYQKPLMRR